MARKKRGDKVDGWAVIDKPVGIGSTPVVGRVRRVANAQKAGHAGTLDPLASGILPIALGEATKTVPYIMDATKEYEFTICFGSETETDDLEGEVTVSGGNTPSEEEITETLSEFIGSIDQVPPAYSAIKVDGQRAYDLARAGKDVELKSRKVEIFDLKLTEFDGDSHTASFAVTCGKGTYVRSLGRDIARRLGTYAHITKLRRTRVGPFSLDRAISLEKWNSFSHSAPAVAELLPVMTALDDILALAVTAVEADRIRQGQKITREDLFEGEALPDTAAPRLCVLTFEDRLIAIAEIDGNEIKSVRGFNL